VVESGEGASTGLAKTRLRLTPGGLSKVRDGFNVRNK
jgi:hypothetical protein